MRVMFAVTLCLVASTALTAQSRYAGPIVDVHVHTTAGDERLREFADNRIARAVVFGRHETVAVWGQRMPDAIIPSLALPCLQAAAESAACYPNGGEFPNVEWVRRELNAGRIRAFGELLQQYAGMSPTDPRLAPYFALAEEFDVPIGIHLSLAPPGISATRPSFRTYLGRPQLLEDVLTKHPKLRVYVMHAGYPYTEEMLALMYIYPNVSVDIAAITMPQFLPRVVFHEYLKRFIDVGLHQRIMFGSDYGGATASTIDAVESAPYLTFDQKRDIFCGNAVRFFRITNLKCS